MGRKRIYASDLDRVRAYRMRKKEKERQDIEDTGLTGYLNRLIRKGYPITYNIESGWRPDKGNVNILEVEVKKPYPQESVKLIWNLDKSKEHDIKMELERVLNE